MTKKLISFLLNSMLIIIFFYIFIYSKIVKETIIFGINLWLHTLIPSIFPFLLISKLLVKYNILNIINNLFGSYIEKLFKISKNSTYVVLLSIISGFPSGSIYIKDLLEKKQISVKEANKLITFTSFSSPLFVISFIGETLLNNRNIGINIYLIHLITGLLVGFLFKSDINRNINNKPINNEESFIKNLIDSLNESFSILINMLGIILFFLIILSLLNTFLPNNIITLLLKGLIEITTGVIYISKSSLSIKLKSSLIGLIISFNGLSIHFQVKNIINNSNINYKNYLIARIIHAVLCFIVVYAIVPNY